MTGTDCRQDMAAAFAAGRRDNLQQLIRPGSHLQRRVRNSVCRAFRCFTSCPANCI